MSHPTPETYFFLVSVRAELCPTPSNEYVEALTPRITVFGDRTFKEIQLH